MAYISYRWWTGMKSDIGLPNICRIINDGLTWELVYGPGDLLTGAKPKALVSNPVNANRIYAGFTYYNNNGIEHLGFLRSNDYGANNTWFPASNGLGKDSVYSIAVDPLNGNILFAGTATHGVFYSSNNGDDWIQTGLVDIDVNVLAIDPDYPDTMYAGSNNPNGVYKTNDGGSHWQPINIGLDYNYIIDFTVDHSEPTLFYTLCKDNATASQTYVYCTVDRGAKWFDVTAGIPSEIKTRDLEIDHTVTDPVFAATDKGLYTYTPDFDKHMVSSSNYATANNNGRKLIRIIESDNLWTVYESGGVIYAVRSEDCGQTWSKKMEIGRGYYPCIASQPAMIGQPAVGIVWRGGNLIQDTIYFAYCLGDNAWSEPFMIAVGSESISFDPPSLVIDEQAIAHVAYANNGSIYHAWFDVTTPGNATIELIITGLSNQNPKNPCIGYLSSAVKPMLHVVWEDDAVVYYSFRVGDPPVWSDLEAVSQSDYPILHDCHHPALEISGDVVYIVWDGKDGSNNQDIYWRNLSWIDGTPYWSWILNVCGTEASSQYPVLASGFYCSWVEDGNEVYYAHYDPFMWTWRDQTNLSQSEGLSGYPHLAYKQVWDATHIYFVWTENSAAPYHIEFRDIQFGGVGGGGAGFLGENGGDALGFYYAETGKETKSSFNLKRTGIKDYGNEPYKKADYDNQYLEYKFSNLNPDKDYGIKVKFYQHGTNNLPLTIKVNNVAFGNINIPHDTLITFQKQIPAILYKNKVVDIKVYGNQALSGTMVLYEFERDKPKGGAQDINTVNLQPGDLRLNIYPIPARMELKIEYQLLEKGRINIGLYDVTGRLVSIPLNEMQNPGRHDQTLDIDELSQGIYFLRLEAGKQVMVKKVTVLK